MKELLEQAHLLGCTVLTMTADSGTQVNVSHVAEDRHWSAFVHWGEEDRAGHKLQLWLNTLPWPTEDDPRVEHRPTTTDEGAYV